MLKLLDFTKTFEVHTNTSNRVLGSILVQKGHPIAFDSIKLKDTKQMYLAH